MRFRAFPVSVLVDGALVEPALLWATDEVVQVWKAGATRDEKVLVASYAGAVSQQRVRGEWLEPGEGDKRRAIYAIELTDGSRLVAGKSIPCGCGSSMRSWSPPVEVDV